MANALGRDIKEGEVVVLRKSSLSIEYDQRKWRVFTVASGFGMSHAARGTALYGTFPADAGALPQERMDGYDVDPIATATYQADPDSTE
jgi:hypothetical protein